MTNPSKYYCFFQNAIITKLTESTLSMIRYYSFDIFRPARDMICILYRFSKIRGEHLADLTEFMVKLSLISYLYPDLYCVDIY